MLVLMATRLEKYVKALVGGVLGGVLGPTTATNPPQLAFLKMYKMAAGCYNPQPL